MELYETSLENPNQGTCITLPLRTLKQLHNLTHACVILTVIHGFFNSNYYMEDFLHF